MNNKSNTDKNLLKLKVALATGGLMATLIGAGLLGKEAGTLTADSLTNFDTETITTTNTNTAITNNTTIPEGLDLDLEAIPTVAAPAFSGDNNSSTSSNNSSGPGMPVARGHSSG